MIIQLPFDECFDKTLKFRALSFLEAETMRISKVVSDILLDGFYF